MINNQNIKNWIVIVNEAELPGFISQLPHAERRVFVDKNKENDLEACLFQYLLDHPNKAFPESEWLNQTEESRDKKTHAVIHFMIDKEYHLSSTIESGDSIEKNKKPSLNLSANDLLRLMWIKLYKNGKLSLEATQNTDQSYLIFYSLLKKPNEISSSSIEIIPSDSETALLNNEISTSYTPPRDMNRLVRWMKQNSLSEKLFLYPHVKWGIGDKKNFSSGQYIFHYPSCPLTKEKNIRAIAFTHYFFNGLKLMLDRAWPAAFYGMFLNDVIHYTISSAATRYGVSASDIVLGHAKTAQVWTSSWGSAHVMDLYPNTEMSALISHFAAPTLIAGTVLLASSYRMLAGAKAVLSDSSHQEARPLPRPNFILDTLRWLNPLPWGLSAQLEQAIFNLQHQQIDADWGKTFNQIKYIIERYHSLLRLSAIDGIAKVANTATLMRKNDPLMLSSELQVFYADLEERCFSLLKEMAHHSLYAKYTLWAHGYEKQEEAILGWQSLFWVQSLTMILLVWISKLKLAEMVALKIYEYKADLDNEKACHQEGKQWFYIKEWAEQICTLCGDWPFVSLNDQFTAQGCFRALLDNEAPSVIINQMERFFNQTTIEEVEELNLSNQHLNTWTVKEWNAFLNKTMEIGAGIKKIHLSNGKAKTFSLNDDKLIGLAEFINQGEVEELDLSEQNLTAESIEVILSALRSPSLERINLENNKLQDEGAIHYANFLKQKTNLLKSLQLATNDIGDNGMASVMASLSHHTNITEIYINNNRIGQLTINNLVEIISTLPITHLNIGYNNLSNLNLVNFWHHLATQSLSSLDLSGTALTSKQITELKNYLPHFPVQQLKLNDNHFNDLDLSHIITSLSNNTVVSSLSFDNIRLKANSLTLLGKCLPSQVQELSLAECNMTSDGFTAFLSQLLIKKYSLNKLILANNKAGDGLIHSLNLALQKGMQIDYLDLSGNELTDTGIELLVKALINNKIKIKTLILSHNMLSDKSAVALATIIVSQKIEYLDISHNLIGAEGSEKLGTALSQSAIKHLDISHNPAGRGVRPFIEKLITPFPDMRNDGELHISLDERRALREAKSNTTLTYLDVTDTNMDSSTTTLACRIQPQVNTTLRFSSMYTCRDRLKNGGHSANNLQKNRLSRQIKSEEKQTLQSNLFSSSLSPSINTFSNGIIAPDAHTNPSSTSLSMGTLFILGCTNPIVTLVLMYVLYRAVSPSVQKLTQNIMTTTSDFVSRTHQLKFFNGLNKKENNSDEIESQLRVNQNKFN